MDKIRLGWLVNDLNKILFSGSSTSRQQPLWEMYRTSVEELKNRCYQIELENLFPEEKGWIFERVYLDGRMGGGSNPEVALPGYGFRIKNNYLPADKLKRILAEGELPVLGSVQKEHVLINLRSVQFSELEELNQACIYPRKKNGA